MQTSFSHPYISTIALFSLSQMTVMIPINLTCLLDATNKPLCSQNLNFLHRLGHNSYGLLMTIHRMNPATMDLDLCLTSLHFADPDQSTSISNYFNRYCYFAKISDQQSIPTTTSANSILRTNDSTPRPIIPSSSLLQESPIAKPRTTTLPLPN